MKHTTQRWNLAGQMPLISLIVLCAVTALLTNRFLSPLNLTNILVQSSIMAVIAMGMTFVIVGGGFDLSVGRPPRCRGASRHGHARGRDRGRRGGRNRRRRGGRAANGLVIAFLNVNPFITTLGHHGAGARRGVSHHRRLRR
jgi:Ribose/xylose/arabinose/galactoside ABC-type transport systems, permease components